MGSRNAAVANRGGGLAGESGSSRSVFVANEKMARRRGEVGPQRRGNTEKGRRASAHRFRLVDRSHFVDQRGGQISRNRDAPPERSRGEAQRSRKVEEPSDRMAEGGRRVAVQEGRGGGDPAPGLSSDPEVAAEGRRLAENRRKFPLRRSLPTTTTTTKVGRSRNQQMRRDDEQEIGRMDEGDLRGD